MKESPIDKQRIRFLYEKYLDHSIQEDEYMELLQATDSAEIQDMLGEKFRTSWEDISHEFEKSMFVGNSPGSINKNKFKIKWIVRWGGVAAAVVLLIISLIQWDYNNSEAGWVSFNTGYAETMEINLEDGSTVLLNANSELRWKNDWESVSQREVWLSGEAYFDVHPIRNGVEKIPFQVKTSEITLDVLGTTFNIKDYGTNTRVYLQEGKIEMRLNSIRDSSYLLTDGDQVVISKNNHEVRTQNRIPQQDAASWVQGELRFSDVQLGEILQQLESIYGIEFEIEDSTVLNIPMNFGAPYGNWSVVERALEMSLSVDITPMEKKMVIEKSK